MQAEFASMDFFEKAPDWLIKAVPEGGARDFLEGSGWFVVLGIIALIVLLILRRLLFRLFTRSGTAVSRAPNLEEDLETYPPLPPSTGDRQLRVEGVPVRMRLVVVAPAGAEGEVDAEDAVAILERALPGLGAMCRADKPRIKVWPRQLSYEGFSRLFQRNMLTRDAQGEMSRWVLLAGRVKFGGPEVFVDASPEDIPALLAGRAEVRRSPNQSRAGAASGQADDIGPAHG